MLKKVRESAAIGISLMGWLFAFLCFIPIMVLHSQQMMEESSTTDLFYNTTTQLNSTSSGDDYYYIVGFDEQPSFREATISALIVSIPLALDTLLDILPSWVSVLLFAENRQLPIKNSGTALFHLTLAEKISFIVGMICLSAISFPSVRSYDTPAVLYLTFLNVNTILATCPIMAFLTRCAPTWTPLRSTVIAFLICTASMLSSFSNLVDPTTEAYSKFSLAINTIITIAFGLFVFMCSISAVNTVWFQVPYPDGTPVNQSATKNNTSDSNSAQDLKRLSTDRIRNCVVAAHMTATFIEAVINPVWYFETGKLNYYDFSIFVYILVAASSLVYVTEFRARKSEVTRALIDLLDAKKSYVRYISHELRTPMNAAFLGLKFVIDNMKGDAELDPTIADTYDTLCDVQTACSTAVDILNDLLTFEKLESGILELHKTEVCAEELVCDCVNLFSAQAREKDILLVCELRVTDTDKLMVDKFKIDQVLRNLISNAIKFSPPGGTVTVQVFFDNGCALSATATDCDTVTAVIPHELNHEGNNEGKDIEEGVIEKSNAALLTGNLVIKVIDEGAGMSAENQKRLFNEVVQFNPDKLQAGGGSGFGLFICKGIVDLHGGKISVFSEGEGKGSTFTLELPMTRQSYGKAPSGLANSNIVTIATRRLEMGRKLNNDHSKPVSVAVAAGQLRRLSLVLNEFEREECVGTPGHSHLVNSMRRFSSNDSAIRRQNSNTSHNDISLILDRQDSTAAGVTAGVVTDTDKNKYDDRNDRKCRRPVPGAAACDTHTYGSEKLTGGLTTGCTTPSSLNHAARIPTAAEICNAMTTATANSTATECIDRGRDGGGKECSAVDTSVAMEIPGNEGDKSPSNSSESGQRSAPHQIETVECPQKISVLAPELRGETFNPSYEILVVDDSPMNRKMLIKILKAAGHVCEEAEDGVEAVEKVKQRMSSREGKREYDAILMDFVMPNMDGPTATKEIRQLDYRGPIFGVTGNGLESDIKHFESCGANKVLVKPFKLEEFKSLMTSLHYLQQQK